MLNHENHITDDMLVSYLLEEADEAAKQSVEQWIIETPANQKYFDHFKIIWEASKEIKIPDIVDENAAWQRFKQRTAAAGQRPVISITKKVSRLRVAAAVIAAVSILGLSYFIWDRTSSAPVTIASINKSETKELPDGSTVTLNKNSVIEYTGRFKGDKRKIKLKGEAFFDVTADKNKPFIVEVDDVTVTVLGTSFNIKNTGGNTEVIVETGFVQVTKNNKTIILKAKEKVIVEAKDSIIEKDTNTDQLYNYYRTNEFVCDNTALWKLVEVLNDAYQVNIIIENNEIRNLPLTTTFNNESLDNILNIISETFNITVEKEANTIILK